MKGVSLCAKTNFKICLLYPSSSFSLDSFSLAYTLFCKHRHLAVSVCTLCKKCIKKHTHLLSYSCLHFTRTDRILNKTCCLFVCLGSALLFIHCHCSHVTVASVSPCSLPGTNAQKQQGLIVDRESEGNRRNTNVRCTNYSAHHKVFFC